MDFVGGLPMTKKVHDYLFVVVDRFSKMYVLILCKKTLIGKYVVNLFFYHVWVHFGIPISIISNRERRFLGKFWTCLWENIDTRLKRSTAFHPQMDGNTKVVNRIVVQLLRVILVSILILGMNILNISSIHTIGKFILPLGRVFLRLVLDIYHLHLLILCLGSKGMKSIHLRKRKNKLKILLKRLGKFISNSKSNLRQAKPSTR